MTLINAFWVRTSTSRIICIGEVKRTLMTMTDKEFSFTHPWRAIVSAIDFPIPIARIMLNVNVTASLLHAEMYAMWCSLVCITDLFRHQSLKPTLLCTFFSYQLVPLVSCIYLWLHRWISKAQPETVAWGEFEVSRMSIEICRHRCFGKITARSQQNADLPAKQAHEDIFVSVIRTY